MALPNETLFVILNELPPSSLAAVSCVSSRFNAIAERILYSSVFVTDFLTQSSPYPIRTLRWCDAVLRRPHLLELMKRITIRWQADPTAPAPHYLVTACEKVNHILRLSLSLESLEIFLGPANLVTIPHIQPMHAVERIIYGCQFDQLRYCSLSAEWTKGVQPYTSVLTSFLTALPLLRHLKLSDLYSGGLGEIPPLALTLLSSFRGSPEAAASLLPGRPVQYLALIGHDSGINRYNLSRMAHGSAPLKYFDLSAISIRLVCLRDIATYFPAVETLRIKLALRHTLHYAFSGISILTGLSAVLSLFTHLNFLDLSPTEVEGVGRADVTEEVKICREWHRVCPSLRRVIFPSQTEWVWVLDFDSGASGESGVSPRIEEQGDEMLVDEPPSSLTSAFGRPTGSSSGMNDAQTGVGLSAEGPCRVGASSGNGLWVQRDHVSF